MVTRHVKQYIKQKEKAAQMMQDHPDVKHPVLAHLPIHVIKFLNICDKNSWAASPEASLDGLMQTSVPSGFLIGSYWFGAKPETSEPSAGEKIFQEPLWEIEEDNQETTGSLSCQDPFLSLVV